MQPKAEQTNAGTESGNHQANGVSPVRVGLIAIGIIASVAVFALLAGLPFAIGLVVLIFIHELGHIIQLRREGIAVSAPVFVPFVGAYVKHRELPGALASARVALAGPLLGTLAALLLLPLGLILNSELLITLCYVGLLLNLFNLIPIAPLDGGKAMDAVHSKIWIIGLIVLVAVAVIRGHGFGLVIFAGLLLLARWLFLSDPDGLRESYAEDRAEIEAELADGKITQEKADKKLQKLDRDQANLETMVARNYRAVTPRQRIAILAVYFGIAAVCVVGMLFTRAPNWLN